jgi:ATP-dependent DNA helicase RecG
MSLEGQNTDRKSLRFITGKTADWPELAKDCVCFANGNGGRILIGIEDGELVPPAGQRISPSLPEKISKRVGDLTVNVQVLPAIKRSGNGGEYVELTIHRSASVASTSDGRYYLRVGDACRPVVGDDVLRLADERPGRPWETMVSLSPASGLDSRKLAAFVAAVHTSDRIKASVKEKSDGELLRHYSLVRGDSLTNLGVLLLGTVEQRRNLGTAPIIQAIKYDEMENKINKWVWDDHALSPVEVIDAVWREVPDFRESYEIAEGFFRRSVPAYDEKVVRELLVNALVHRPYTQRGDIFLNLHSDRLEVVNPGRLPLGVTPTNILHASRRRNDEMARVFHDLGLMEREGSGFDLIYDRLLSLGRPIPELHEGTDWVKVSIQRRIFDPAVIHLIEAADKRFQLTQRERITLGVLALSEGMKARELADRLDLADTDALKSWMGRLQAMKIIGQAGKTKGTRYFVAPDLLRRLDFPASTSLARIEPHRLDALIVEDVNRYPGSAISEIHQRIGKEIKRRQVKLALDRLRAKGLVAARGDTRARAYWPARKDIDENS